MLRLVVGGGLEVDAVEAGFERCLRAGDVQRPSASVLASSMESHAPSLCSARARPGRQSAGRPSAVSRMCVEIPMVSLTPSHRRRRSCVIWRCCSAASSSSVGGRCPCAFEDGEDLGGGLARGADDEDAAELLFVLRFASARASFAAVVCGRHAARCSCADQRSDSAVAWRCACCWPMRGWLSKACCQSASGRRAQTLSEVSRSQLRRRRAACGEASAQAREPQQGRISRAAASAVEGVPAGEDMRSLGRVALAIA